MPPATTAIDGKSTSSSGKGREKQGREGRKGGEGRIGGKDWREGNIDSKLQRHSGL